MGVYAQVGCCCWRDLSVILNSSLSPSSAKLSLLPEPLFMECSPFRVEVWCTTSSSRSSFNFTRERRHGGKAVMDSAVGACQPSWYRSRFHANTDHDDHPQASLSTTGLKSDKVDHGQARQHGCADPSSLQSNVCKSDWRAVQVGDQRL